MVCRFPGLLQELEAAREALGIDSYGLAVTTLEEVFLTVSAQAAAEGAKSGNAGQQHEAEPGSRQQVVLEVGAAKGNASPEAAIGGRGLNGAAASQRDMTLTKVPLLGTTSSCLLCKQFLAGDFAALHTCPWRPIRQSTPALAPSILRHGGLQIWGMPLVNSLHG